MPKCVAIEMADDGTVKVGPIPPEATAQYADALQPVKTLADAFDTANDLLTGETGEQAQEAEQVATGYNRVKGAGGPQAEMRKLMGGM